MLYCTIMKHAKILLLSIITAIVSPSIVSAHCQVPCGIFGDDRTFSELYENVETIEKAMISIAALQENPDQNMNQIVRWVVTKEDHAQKIQNIAAKYFLAQRIKMDLKESDEEKYVAMLKGIHSITFYAMKCKHGIDTTFTEKLTDAIHDFQHLYMGDDDHQH